MRLHAWGQAEAEESTAAREAVLERVVDSLLTRVALVDLLVMGGERLRVADHRERLRAAAEEFGDPGDEKRGAMALAWLVVVGDDVLAVLRVRRLDPLTWQLA